MSTPKTVDYLDLKLRLNETQKVDVQSAIDRFEDEFDYVVKSPRVKGEELRINSMDLVHFLGYLDSSSWLPIDRRRFRRMIQSELEQLLLKSLNPDYQYHYKWCLSAINNLAEGRYLEPLDNSSNH